MKLNLNQLLIVVAFFGSVNCDGKSELKNKLEKALEQISIPHDVKDPSAHSPLREKMIIALKYPKCFIDKAFVIDDVDLKCKDDDAHKFFRFNFKDEVESDAKFSSYCKKNVNLDALTDSDLKKEILDQYQIKKDYLEAIVKNIPIVQDYVGGSTDEFDIKIQSHIEKFVADALVYDGKRYTFSNLHKAIESILNAHEVDRKAQDAIKGALAMINNDKTEWKKIEDIKTGLVIKKSEPSPNGNGNKDPSAAKAVEDKKPQNIITVSLEASNKSTSSPLNLGFFLAASVILASLLLGFKAYTAKPAKEEDEEFIEE